MNFTNYLYIPGLHLHPDLYLHKNVSLESAQPQTPPAHLQDHGRKKRNILSMAGKKFRSLLGPTKNLKLRRKRADTPIPILLPPLVLEVGGTSTGLYANRRKIWRKYVRGDVPRNDLVGQGYKFQSGRVGTAVNADAFRLHAKRWRPVMEVIPEEEEEMEEKQEGEEKGQNGLGGRN